MDNKNSTAHASKNFWEQFRFWSLIKRALVLDKDKIVNPPIFEYRFQTKIEQNSGEVNKDKNLEQKIQQFGYGMGMWTSSFYQSQKNYEISPKDATYKIKIPAIKTVFKKLKAPVEEQVALEKATERLNPLQPLKPIKPYWEADFIKKVLQYITDFIGLENRQNLNISYSFSYQDEGNYQAEH